MQQVGPPRFPRSFWSANLVELCERGAYYSMASFVVIYLGLLGLGSYWPSTLNGILWSLVYFLPILSGTIADQVGYRRSLLAALGLLVVGYGLLGLPVWSGQAGPALVVGDGVTAGLAVIAPAVLAVLVIGVGGSIVKPCILGTVQKTAGSRATLAFAIFYMVVNIGSLVGRGVAYGVRTAAGRGEATGLASLSRIFAVAMAFSLVGLLLVWWVHRDPAPAAGSAAPRRSVREILVGMVRVLGNLRFALFLVVMSGFWFLYSQVYNLLPLYLKRVVEASPAVDLYTMANPLVIVSCQLLVTRRFGGLRPIRSILVGIVVISLSMLINLVPMWTAGGVRSQVFGLVPMGALFVILTVALIAFGELFASARTFEFIGALAPKGQEGLFLGYANLPMAIGALLGGPAGAAIFNEVMCRHAKVRPDGLLDLDPRQAALGWSILTLIGLASGVSMWLYNRWVERSEAKAVV